MIDITFLKFAFPIAYSYIGVKFLVLIKIWNVFMSSSCLSQKKTILNVNLYLSNWVPSFCNLLRFCKLPLIVRYGFFNTFLGQVIRHVSRLVCLHRISEAVRLFGCISLVNNITCNSGSQFLTFTPWNPALWYLWRRIHSRLVVILEDRKEYSHNGKLGLLF